MSGDQQIEYIAICAAYRHLEDDLAEVMGAGFEQTARYQELVTGAGEAADGLEQDLIARAVALKCRVQAMEAAVPP